MESSRYEPPVRRSLSDEDLAKRVNEATASHNGMEAVMDLLVAQEALRAQEDAELEAWVEQMEAEGSAQALAALAKFQGRPFLPAVEPEVPEDLVVEVPEPEPTVEEQPEAQPFSWFTQLEETDSSTQDAPENDVEEVIEVVEVVEVVEVSDHIAEADDLVPVGSESTTDFERLLTAASAEEEATALEDGQTIETGPTNLLVPTDEHRNRKPISQLVIWLGASAVLVPLVLVTVLSALGLSAQTVALDLALGYLISGTLLATAGLAGKRSGLSTGIISRAVFGVWGNSFPLTFVTISRLILSTVLISVLLVFVDGKLSQLQPFDSIVFESMGIKLPIGYLFGIAVIVLVFVISILRGKTSRYFLLGLSILGFASILVSLAGIGSKPLAFSTPGVIGFLSRESFAAIALVIAVQLILWVELTPNLSKAIPMKPRGLKVFLVILASQGIFPLIVALVAILFIGPNLLSAFSFTELGPINGLVSLLPSWSATLLAVAVFTSLIYTSVLSLKSLSLDLIALVRIRSRILATLLASVLVAILLLQFVQQPESRTVEYLVTMAVLAATISAGWIGMFIADVGLRKIAYHELSLNRSYGYYGRFNLLSLGIWVVTLVLGIFMIPVNLVGLSFTGMLAANVGLDSSLGSQAISICLVILSGALLTLIARIPQIRKQEKEVLAVESRREQLNDIFIGQE